MKHTITAILVALVAALTLTAAPATARADEMTVEQAGKAYLAAVCKGTDAGVVYSRTIWRGRDTISTAEARVRLPQLKRAAAAYGRALNKGARMLFNPEAGDWPAAVSSDVARVAKANANESYWRLRQARATSAQMWFRFAARGNKAGDAFGTAAVQIRAILDLPPPGEGC